MDFEVVDSIDIKRTRYSKYQDFRVKKTQHTHNHFIYIIQVHVGTYNFEILFRYQPVHLLLLRIGRIQLGSQSTEGWHKNFYSTICFHQC